MKTRISATALIASTALILAGCTSNVEAEAGAGDGSATAGDPRSWAEIQESGVLRVGTITDYPPNEFKTDDGEPTGWAVELVEAMADELGLDVEYELLLFDNILPRVQGGTIDIGVGSFGDTLEREEAVDFVNYYRAGTLWVAQEGADVDPDAACGLTVAVMTGGTQHLTELPEKSAACEAAGEEPIEILPFTGQPEVTNAVVTGQAAAFSADSSVSIDAVDTLGGLEIVGEMFDTMPYGFPIAKGSELGEHAVAALQTLMDDGTYLDLLEAYHSELGAIDTASLNIAAEEAAAAE